MREHTLHFVAPTALLCAALLLGCGKDRLAPDGVAPRLSHGRGGHAGGVGQEKIPWNVDALAGDFCVPGDPANWVSTSAGTTDGTGFHVVWGDAIVVTPDGGYTLSDDAEMTAESRGGDIRSVRFWIDDVAGPDGIQHSSDDVSFDPPVVPDANGFTLHVHASALQVWRHKQHLGGPRVQMIGTICVGDLIFTPR